MKIAIVGNGILGLQAAYRLIKDDGGVKITIVGPAGRPGCASLAAAAMFNSYCEVDGSTLKNPIERQKFLFNRSANDRWPDLLAGLERDAGAPISHGFGTFLINNQASNRLEDENFDAVLAALAEFKEPHRRVEARDIPHYKPAPVQRAARAVFIEREGWVNPIHLLAALRKVLDGSGRVEFVDGACDRLVKTGAVIDRVETSDGRRVAADAFILCPGANFSQIVDRSQLGLPMQRIFYGVGATVLLKTEENTLPNCVRTPNRGLACGIYAAPQDAAFTIIGASNFISPVPMDHVRLTSVYTLLKSAMEQINADYYRADLVRVNVGWRPTSADTLPLIGPTSISNLIVATGTKRDGLHCSPVIAEYLSETIRTGRSRHDLSLYRPERKRTVIHTREDAIRIAVAHTINAAYQHDFVPAKNRMVDHLERFYTDDLSKLHDAVGARDWGIPPEMIDMYRYGHVPADRAS